MGQWKLASFILTCVLDRRHWRHVPAALPPTPVHSVGPTAGLKDLGKTETFRPC